MKRNIYAAAVTYGRQATWWRRGRVEGGGWGGGGGGRQEQQQHQHRRGLSSGTPPSTPGIDPWGDKKDHAMYYRPKKVEFEPLRQWQYAAAAWNRYDLCNHTFFFLLPFLPSPILQPLPSPSPLLSCNRTPLYTTRRMTRVIVLPARAAPELARGEMLAYKELHKKLLDLVKCPNLEDWG